MGNHQIVMENEPLIVGGPSHVAFLMYKRDSGYEIYRVEQTDSPDYRDWTLTASIYINDPRYFGYLNGAHIGYEERGNMLSLISAPSQDGQ